MKNIMSNARQLLIESALFEGANDAVIETLLQRAEPASFAVGEIPVAEATVTHQILLIVEGELQIEIALQSPDQNLEMLNAGPGTFLGLVNFFSKVSQPFTATALTEIKTLTWKPEDWRQLCEADPEFGYQLSQRIGGALVERMSNWISQILNTVSWGV